MKRLEPPSTLPSQFHDEWTNIAAKIKHPEKLSQDQMKAMERLVLAQYELDAIAPRIFSAIQRGDSSDAERWICAQDRLSKIIEKEKNKLRFV